MKAAQQQKQHFPEESLAMAQEIGDKELLAPGLEGLASVVAVQGEQTWATRL